MQCASGTTSTSWILNRRFHSGVAAAPIAFAKLGSPDKFQQPERVFRAWIRLEVISNISTVFHAGSAFPDTYIWAMQKSVLCRALSLRRRLHSSRHGPSSVDQRTVHWRCDRERRIRGHLCGASGISCCVVYRPNALRGRGALSLRSRAYLPRNTLLCRLLYWLLLTSIRRIWQRRHWLGWRPGHCWSRRRW